MLLTPHRWILGVQFFLLKHDQIYGLPSGQIWSSLAGLAAASLPAPVRSGDRWAVIKIGENSKEESIRIGWRQKILYRASKLSRRSLLAWPSLHLDVLCQVMICLDSFSLEAGATGAWPIWTCCSMATGSKGGVRPRLWRWWDYD